MDEKESLNISKPIHGRGVSLNPANRFEKIALEEDPEYDKSLCPSLKTEFFKDTSKTIITYNDSPDIPFRTSLNPYRGCEHGCVYCYARPYHEYLGLSSGLDFESKIFVKMDAPALLRKELLKSSWQPQVVVMSGITDCYQPVERRLKITRGCLEVLLEFRNPVAMITKNHLVTRDVDILKQMAPYGGCMVNVSLTTLDRKLANIMEPRTSTPLDRLKTIEELSKAGIPVGVMTAPIIPGLNDHEIPKLLKAARESGARVAGYVILRLPFAVKDLFQSWLTQHFPDRKEKVLNRLRSMREGKLYNPEFGKRMRGEGVFAQQIDNMFHTYYKKYNFDDDYPTLSSAHFHKPCQEQLSLF